MCGVSNVRYPSDIYNKIEEYGLSLNKIHGLLKHVIRLRKLNT